MDREFIDFFEECNSGAFANDVSKMLASLLAAVEKQGRGGELTIKLKIQPNGDGTASVYPTVSEKRPSRKRAPSEFYFHKGGLYKNNPAQKEMFNSKNVRSIAGDNEI